MLLGQRVRLRALEKDDLRLSVRWMNDPDIRRMLSRSAPLSMNEEERWFEEMSRSQTHAYFLIEHVRADGEQPIGICGLTDIDWKNRSSDVGITIGEKDLQGKGLGPDALRVLLEYGFLELGLHRIELEVLSSNTRALRCYEKVGFHLDGTRRQAFFRDGRWQDILLMSMLFHELPPTRPAEAIQ